LPTANTERVQALQTLARYSNGCSEALMLAHGFTVAFLAGLVRGRLVTADLDASHVVWMQITDLGREALARQLNMSCGCRSPTWDGRLLLGNSGAPRPPKSGSQRTRCYILIRCQNAINRRPTDLEGLRDVYRPHPLRL
jgi:hypothetical protein